MSVSSALAWSAELSPEDAFEQAWQRHYQFGEEVPQLANYLPAASDPDYVQITVHLIEIDLERRWCASRFQKQASGLADTSTGANEHPTDRPEIKPRPLADYLQSLHWNGDSEWLPDLLAAEYEAQRRAGQIVAVNEYLDRYAKFREVLRERFAAIDAELRQELQAAVKPSGEAFPEIPGYVIERELGRGGMSVVYLAYDLSLHRQVAIKHLKHAPRSAAELARLELEPAVQAQFRHPNVVRIHGKGTSGGRPYLVCEYVNGQSLREAIRTTTLAPQRAAEIVAHIARTMHAVHDAGILHRDLKPENILLDQAGTPLVADFGIAKVTPDHAWVQAAAAQGQIELTMQGEVMGTPGYMAPEQAAGNVGHDKTIDVYGLGGILYAVLTGRPPFFGSTREETMHSVKHDEPVEPRRLNPRVPRDLNTICLKCLAKNPQRRYATAKEVAEDLERFVKGEPIQARAVGPIERVVRWCARNRAVASLIAAIILLVLIGTGVSAFYANSYIEADRRFNSQLRLTQMGRLRRVHQMIQQANFSGALRLLQFLQADRTRQPTRRFEWNYALRLCHSEQLALTEQKSEIVALAVSPDGSLIVSAGLDGELRIVRYPAGDLLHSLQLKRPVSKITFNHDGSRLAVVTQDGAIGIWTIGAQCREEISYRAHLMPVDSIAFHPRSNLIVSVSSDAGLHLWDATSGQLVFRKTGELTDYIAEAFFAPDGKSVWAFVNEQAAPGRGGLWQLDVDTEQFAQLPIELTVPKPEEPAYISAASVSSDSRWLYVRGTDRRIRGYQLGDLAIELKWTLPSTRGPHDLVVTTEWVGVFDRSSKEMLLYDNHSGWPLRALRGHTEPIAAAAASHDGRVVALAARNRLIKVWNGNEELDGQMMQGHQGWIKVLAISPDGKTIASGGNDHGVFLWDLETATRIHRLGKHDVKTEPTSDGTIGALRSVGTYFGHQGFISGLAFSSDSRLVLSLGEDQRLMVWDVASGKRQQDFATKVIQPRGLVRHPVRDEVAFYDMYGVVHLFDWVNGVPVGKLEIPGVKLEAVAYSPDGELLAVGGSQGTVRLFRGPQREPHQVLQGMAGDVRRVTFNRNGQLLVASDSLGDVRVWELPKPQAKYLLEGFGERLVGLNFDADDRLIVSNGFVGRRTVEIWDPETNQELLSIPGSFEHCLMTADGTRLVAATGESLGVRILDSRPVDNQAYRREPLALQPPPKSEPRFEFGSLPLEAIGYFSADSVPRVSAQFDKSPPRWLKPQNGRHFVGVKLVIPRNFLQPTEAEFRANYRDWDPDGETPIERTMAGWLDPAHFRLHASTGESYPATLHADWPLATPSQGFWSGTVTSRFFEPPQGWERHLAVFVFEVPRDADLSSLQIQHRESPPINVPDDPFPAPDRDTLGDEAALPEL